MRNLSAVVMLGMGLVLGGLRPAGAAEPGATVTISARFAGEAPRAMVVTTDAENAALQLDPAAGVFRGAVSLAQRINDVDLQIDYPDSAQYVLPLRLSAGTPSVAVVMKRPVEVRCTNQVLARLGLPAASLQDAVQKYLAAKAINEISGADRCGTALRRLATKTWFDASYALVAMKPFFRLDPGAKAAYAALDPLQARTYSRQADAAHMAAMYRQSLALFSAGQVASALDLNTDLKAELDKDPALAKATQDLQGVSPGRLVADSALFEAKALESPPV